MSTNNYDNYNIYNTEPPAGKNKNKTASERIKNSVNRIDGFTREERLQTITQRAFSRVELDGFKASKARATEIYNSRNQEPEDSPTYTRTSAQEALDNYRELINGGGLYASKFTSTIQTTSDLWQQKNSDMYLNPAVVQEYRKSIEEGRATSSFLTGGANSGQTQESMSTLSNEMAAALQLVAQQYGNSVATSKFAKFYSRPGVKTYRDLFTSGESFRGIYFQFQNNDLLSVMMSKKGTSFQVVTQQLDAKAFDEKDNTRISILAPNELSIGIANRSNTRSIYGATSDSSFHPKLGYIPKVDGKGTISYSLAFIGSQNITPALSSNRTIESLLVFDSNSNNTSTERQAGREIMNYTDFVIGEAEKKNTVMENVDFRLTTGFSERQFLYLQGGSANLTEIKDRYYGLINTAANRTDDKVLLAMDHFTDNALIGDEGKTVRSSLLKLAKENRLVLATNRETLTNSLNSQSTEYKEFIDTLAQYGALRIVPTTKLHEKSISIYDKDNKLVAYGSGSANFSYKALSGSKNVEASVVIGVGSYRDVGREGGEGKPERGGEDKQTYLNSIVGVKGINEQGNLTKSVFQSHYDFMIAGKWGLFNSKDSNTAKVYEDNTNLYLTGYRAEIPSKYSAEEKQRVDKIKQLASDIKKYNVSTLTGVGTVTVEYRYAPETRSFTGTSQPALQPVGLRVKVTSSEGYHSVALDMTVNVEGDVIISDLNKNLNSSLYVNTTNKTQTLFKTAPLAGVEGSSAVSKRVIKAGESVKLNSFETALGLINTLQREFTYQSEYVQGAIYFNRLINEAALDSQTIAKNVIAKQITEIIPSFKRMVGSDLKSTNTNLETLLYNISTNFDATTKNTITTSLHTLLTETKFGTTSDILNLDKTQRRVLLTNLINTIEQGITGPLSQSQAKDLANTVSKVFLHTLSQDSFTDSQYLSDYRKEFIFQHEGYMRKEYLSMAKTQSRVFVSDLLAPFMSAHESTYGDYQGKSRMAVYGEDTNFSYRYGSTMAEFFQQGFLNPLPFSHSTRLGKEGTLYRSLGASSIDNKLTVPHLGGLRQLSLVDSDIGEGAGIVHDYDILAKSTSTLNKLSKQEYIAELQDMELDINVNQINRLFKARSQKKLEDKEIDSLEDTALMFSTFKKAERLTQRLKNVIGSRPAIDISQTWLTSVLSNYTTDPTMYDYFSMDAPATRTNNFLSAEANDIVSGSLRISLSTLQLQKVKEIRKMLATSNGVTPQEITWDDVQKYFREQLLNQNNSEHGFIGPQELKRVGLVTGVNLFSDPNYLNAGYKELLTGKVQRVRNKISVNRLDSATGSRERLAYILGRGGIVTTRSFEEGGKTYEQGFYIRNDNNELERVASYADDGFLEFKDIYEIRNTPFGKRKEAILFKMGAFGERAEGGLTVVIGTPNLTETSRDMNIFEIDSITVNRTDSSTRPAGGDGLAKGPFLVIKKDWFDRLDETFIYKAYDNTLKGQASRSQFDSLMNYKAMPVYKATTFAVMSPNNFKGYAIKGGVSMVGSVIKEGIPSSFQTLYNQEGIDVAKSLAFMFLGDEQVRRALAKDETDQVRRLAILRKDDKIDISTKGLYKANDVEASSLALSASGFLSLQGNATDLELKGLKQLVISALSGDTNSQKLLKDRAKKLLLRARNSGESYGDEVDIDGTKTRSQVQLNEQDGSVRAAGIYASMVLFKTQVFDQKSLLSLNPFSISEMPLNLSEFYHGYSVTKEGSDYKINKFEGDTAKYSQAQYRNVINLVQGHLGTDLKQTLTYEQAINLSQKEKEELYQAYQYNTFLLETLEGIQGKGQVLYQNVDISPSQSLVPAGMKDSVKWEYASYLNLTDKKLRMFREPLGLKDNQEAYNIQQTYFALMALTNNNLFSLTKDQEQAGATFKLPFVNSLTRGTDVTSITKEGYSYNVFNTMAEIDLYTLAALYSKKEGNVERSARKAVNEILKLDSRADNLSVTGYITQLAINDGFLPTDNPYATDIDLVGVNQILGLRMDRTAMGNQERDYIAGIVEVKNALLKELNATTQGTDKYNKILRLYSSLNNSKNILIPNISIELNPAMDGTKLVRIQPFTAETTPALGIFLGADILDKLALVFGDHKSDIINTQIDYFFKFIEALPVLNKLNEAMLSGRAAQLDDREITLYTDFRASAKNTSAAILTVIQSDATRQAFGDHESFRGAVGIPINTNLLNPWEMILGDRMLRLAGQSKRPELGTLLNNVINQIIAPSVFSNAKLQESNLSMLATLINTFTVKGGEVDGVYKLNEIKSNEIKTYFDLDKITKDDVAYSQAKRTQLEDAFNIVVNKNKLSPQMIARKGIAPDRNLTDIEKTLILTAKAYSKILDLGLNQDKTERVILQALVEDYLQPKVTKGRDYDSWESVVTALSNKGTKDSVKNLFSKHTFDRLAELSLGIISTRTGHPGGAAATTSERDNYQPQIADIQDTRATALADLTDEFSKAAYAGAKFVADAERMSAGMLVPSISIFISMLGDYDGDSHRIITSKVDLLLNKINNLYKSNESLVKVINSLSSHRDKSKNTKYKVKTEKDKIVDYLFYKFGGDTNIEKNKLKLNINRFEDDLDNYLQEWNKALESDKLDILKLGFKPKEHADEILKLYSRLTKAENLTDIELLVKEEFIKLVNPAVHDVNKVTAITVRGQDYDYTDCGCNAGFSGGIVLDPFAGSGTTGAVAKRLGRDYILIELNEKYIELIKKRVNKIPENLLNFEKKGMKK